MRVLVQATVAAVLSLALVGVTRADDWAETTVDTFGFSAVFPKAPSSDASDENGVKIHSFAAGTPDAICVVVVGDYPYTIDPDVELPASRDSFAKGIKATATPGTRGTFPRGATQLKSLEFDAVTATHKFRSIIVIEGARAYQVAGGVPKDGGTEANIERCVRGLKLLVRN